MTSTLYEPPAALADLAGVLAHRFRSLVAGIQGCAELLADTVHGAADRALVLQILDGAAGIERMLADLLRYGHDTVPLMQPLPLDALLVSTLAALGPEAGRVRLPAALPTLLLPVDPVLARQALLVLLSNALEATGEQSGQPVAVEVTVEPESVVIVVENEGTLPFDPPERAFEPFVTSKAQHLGLGLPLARRIAHLHGGELVLDPANFAGRLRFLLILRYAPTDRVAALA